MAIKHWHHLSLLYFKSGNTKAFQAVLQEALREKEVNAERSNEHMFDRNDRYEAMNSLASHWFQLYD